MARVVIDLERLRNVHCGLGQFCLHLSRAVFEQAPSQLEIVPLVRPQQRAMLAPHSSPWLPAGSRRRAPLAQLLQPLLALGERRQRFDLWHMTHQDSRYLPASRGVPLLLTIHDLNFLRDKPPATIRRRLRQLQAKVDRCTLITTASQHAAGEIREHLDLRDKQIAVIGHGVCVQPSARDSGRPDFLPGGPFLFTIGDITAKKNFHVLLGLAARLPDFRLVIAGARSSGYAARLAEQVAEAQLSDRVILPGVVSDAERVWLYQHCSAFLFPSLSEGFGLPLIEAMSCGRPVYAARATSLPEVGGPLAFYWDDFHPDALLATFRAGQQRVAADPGFADKLRAHAGQFTWQRAAGQYLTLYQRLLDKDYATRPDETGAELAASASSVREAA